MPIPHHSSFFTGRMPFLPPNQQRQSTKGSIKHRIDFKIANITFRTLHSSQPAYLRSSLHATRSLRLYNTNLLSSPFVRTSLALSVSALQPLKFGTFSGYFSVPVPVLIHSVVISRPTTESKPSNIPNPSPLAPQIRLFLAAVRVYKLYLLTYY